MVPIKSSSELGWNFPGTKYRALSAYPTENVSTVFPSAWSLSAQTAVMRLESSPPDKNIPMGTSATICRRMASVTRKRTCATVSSKLSRCSRSFRDQYRCRCRMPFSKIPKHPRSPSRISLNTPLPGVRPGPSRRISPAPSAVSTGCADGWARMVLISEANSSPLPFCWKKRGFTPILSRASSSLSARSIQRAKAKMPLNRSRAAVPHSAQPCRTTSVSEWVRNSWPRPSNSPRSSAVLYSSPLYARMYRSPAHWSAMGCAPPAGSTMASRVWSSA